LSKNKQSEKLYDIRVSITGQPDKGKMAQTGDIFNTAQF